jgi:hypothetical protein
MATQTRAAGTLTNVETAAVDWSNPTNAGASDDARATASLNAFAGSARTDFLKFSNFGFSIPAGATINGFTFSLERSASSTSGSPRDQYILLTDDGSTPALGGEAAHESTNKASGTTWPTTDGTATYGGASDLWSTGTFVATVSEINASTFSAWVRALKTDGKTSTSVRVDYGELTVHYTEAAGGQPTVKRAGGVTFMHGGPQPGSGRRVF